MTTREDEIRAGYQKLISNGHYSAAKDYAESHFLGLLAKLDKARGEIMRLNQMNDVLNIQNCHLMSGDTP